MPNKNDYKYILIEPKAMTRKHWVAVQQKSLKTSRKLTDGRIIVKYTGLYPILFAGYSPYTNTEIRAIAAEDTPPYPDGRAKVL